MSLASGIADEPVMTKYLTDSDLDSLSSTRYVHEEMAKHATSSSLECAPSNNSLPGRRNVGDSARIGAADLPHEIQLRIFGFLQTWHPQDDCIPPFLSYDTSDVLSAVTVCRSWYPCAVEVLYTSVLLRGAACTAQFARALRNDPNIALLVRKLEFQEDVHDSPRQSVEHRPRWWNVLEHIQTHAHWQRRAFERDRNFILRACARATGLKCYAEALLDRCKHAAPTLGLFENVVDLDLCGSGLGKCRTVQPPVGSPAGFARLRSLTLRSFSLVKFSAYGGTCPAPAHHLQRLSLRKCSISIRYVHLLLHLCPNTTAVRIDFCVLLDSLGHFDRTRVLDIGGLLAPVSFQLQTLAVNFSKVYSVHITAYQFTSLRCLELNWDPARTPIQDLPPNLETLRLVTWYEPACTMPQANVVSCPANVEVRHMYSRELFAKVDEVKRAIPSWKLSTPSFRRLELMHWKVYRAGVHAWAVAAFLFRPWCARWGVDLDVSLTLRT